jgi:hypothetical protein
VESSVDFWRSRPDRSDIVKKWHARSFRAWSAAAAASLYATVGKGDKALEMLHYHHDNRDLQKNIMPNTMYLEVWPVIECSLASTKSVQDMMLLGHQGILRVFPAVPSAWTEAAFHDFRAEGAFLVSASRKKGKTEWLSVRSLAGEPCSIRARFDGPPVVSGSRAFTLAPKGPDTWAVDLQKGETIVLRAPGFKGPCAVEAVPSDPARGNHYGINANGKTKEEYQALLESLEELQKTPLQNLFYKTTRMVPE